MDAIHFIEDFDVRESIEKINSQTMLVIIDEKVKDIYYRKLGLDQIDRNMIIYSVKSGEGLKSISELNKALEFFLEQKINRSAHVVAIGGGSVTDFAGLVAALLLRGLTWTAIPTTLLGMVDAAIGGKVGINSIHGKNLIGSFYLPENVYISLSFLETLDCKEIACGRGEILKYCLLDKICYNLVVHKRPYKDIIRACTDFKSRIVAQDFKESGSRKILNLGHTFGHALEFTHNIPHGVAVAQGIKLVLKMFGRDEVIEKFNELASCLELTESLKIKSNSVPIDEIFEYVEVDKKITTSEKIELITVRDIGYHVIEEIELDKLKKLFTNTWENL